MVQGHQHHLLESFPLNITEGPPVLLAPCNDPCDSSHQCHCSQAPKGHKHEPVTAHKKLIQTQCKHNAEGLQAQRKRKLARVESWEQNRRHRTKKAPPQRRKKKKQEARRKEEGRKGRKRVCSFFCSLNILLQHGPQPLHFRVAEVCPTRLQVLAGSHAADMVSKQKLGGPRRRLPVDSNHAGAHLQHKTIFLVRLRLQSSREGEKKKKKKKKNVGWARGGGDEKWKEETPTVTCSIAATRRTIPNPTRDTSGSTKIKRKSSKTRNRV